MPDIKSKQDQEVTCNQCGEIVIVGPDEICPNCNNLYYGILDEWLDHE